MTRLRPLLTVLLLLLVAAPVQATWSIVVLNRRTGEVGVATATCLTGNTLWRWVPLVVVGRGAAAMQASVDTSGQNAVRIWNGIHTGLTPDEIIAQLVAMDPSISIRQFGIAAESGPAATFTGSNTIDVALGVAGVVGDLEYAIQGNILAGHAVIDACERALRNTSGDTAQKMMAAMEAAALFGGDGRCSCHVSFPTSCGSPPANFTHAAWSSVIVVARIGDQDGTCTGSVPCASGVYYLTERFTGSVLTTDAVVALRQQFDAWRAGLAGVTDQLLSGVTSDLPVLRADGVTSSTVRVQLRDVDGQPVLTGGQALSVTRSLGQAIANPGPVRDLGGGLFEFDLTATALAGRAEFTVEVQDGGRTIALHPALSVASAPPMDLHLGALAYSASAGSPVPLLLDRGVADAGRAYRVLASLSGTSPGTTVGGTLVPLNRDRLFDLTLAASGSAPFVGSTGVLDGQGQASATLDLDAGSLTPFIGARFAFCTLFLGGSVDVSNVVELLVGQ